MRTTTRTTWLSAGLLGACVMLLCLERWRPQCAFTASKSALAIPWRLGQIFCLGVSPLALAVWQWGTLLMILFHHANVHLATTTERWLSRLVVTPRLHTIQTLRYGVLRPRLCPTLCFFCT